MKQRIHVHEKPARPSVKRKYGCVSPPGEAYGKSPRGGGVGRSELRHLEESSRKVVA